MKIPKVGETVWINNNGSIIEVKIIDKCDISGTSFFSMAPVKGDDGILLINRSAKHLLESLCDPPLSTDIEEPVPDTVEVRLKNLTTDNLANFLKSFSVCNICSSHCDDDMKEKCTEEKRRNVVKKWLTSTPKIFNLDEVI